MSSRRIKKRGHGHCALCGRDTLLTFHHLIPRAVHKRNRIKRLFSREEMGMGIDICRKCHNGIHDLYDEMTLALNLNSLEKLKNDPAVLKHVSWVSRQH